MPETWAKPLPITRGPRRSDTYTADGLTPLRMTMSWTRLASGTVRLALGYRLPGMRGVTVAETNTEMN